MNRLPPSTRRPEIERLLAEAPRRRYKAKSMILRRGDAPSAIYYLIDGSVTVAIDHDKGAELILAYLGPGEFFGELGLLDPEQGRSAEIKARTDCEAAVIDYDRFRALCRATPELMLALTRQIADRLRSTTRKVGDLAFIDVTGRIARALLDLAKDSQAMTHPDGMLVRITREELGRLVNCSREMAGKVLKELERQGLIQAKGKNIVIHGAGR